MVLPYCCWGWRSGCRVAWFTTMIMIMATGVVMAIGMAVIAITVIGRGVIIAVIAGMTAVVTTTTTTMTDRDLPSLLGFGHSTAGRLGAPLCFPASGWFSGR